MTDETCQTDGKVVAAEVADDGGSVKLTVEVDTPVLDPVAANLSSMSIGFRDKQGRIL